VSLTHALAIALAIPGAYFAGAVFPPKVVLMLYPRYSPPAPEASSKQGQDLMNAVEREMQELYHVAHLRSRGDEYYETREWEWQEALLRIEHPRGCGDRDNGC
jgi:hypothetical protein